MKQMTLKIVLALAVTVLTAGAAAASERDDVMKVVRQWVDSLNKGDPKTAIAACAEQTTILDEFPPHEWHGAGTCSKWVADLTAFNKSIGLTDGIVTLQKPRRVDVTADRAYVVVPTDFRYKENGKDGAELGALFTVALQKGQAGWRITGWAWSRP
jgi:ketosteroid isomerase-like protein